MLWLDSWFPKCVLVPIRINCEFVTFPLVFWVKCGTWLYRILIFAPLLTLNTVNPVKKVTLKKITNWFTRPIIAKCKSQVLQIAPRGAFCNTSDLHLSYRMSLGFFVYFWVAVYTGFTVLPFIGCLMAALTQFFMAQVVIFTFFLYVVCAYFFIAFNVIWVCFFDDTFDKYENLYASLPNCSLS